MAILSFGKAFHGRMFGSLSTTHSKAIHKIDSKFPYQSELIGSSQLQLASGTFSTTQIPT